MHQHTESINSPNNLAPLFSQSENVARNSSVIPFDFDGAAIRVITDKLGDPWFVARDVADALGYSKPENAVARHCKAPNNSKVVGELAILECFDRLLKPANSSKMMMLAKIAANNGLDAKFLPGYAVDAAPDAAGGSSMPTKAITALIKDHAIASTPRAFNLALKAHGFLTLLQRKNSKQEMVDFWSVTEKGMAYGKNLTSPQCPRETQPHWYVDRFIELAAKVGKA